MPALRCPNSTLRPPNSCGFSEPFGLPNPVPLFLLEDAVAADIVPLSDGKHIRLRLTDGRLEAGAVFFGMTIGEFPVFPGEKCDVIFTLDINEFNGRSSPQLLLRAARPCAAVREGIEAELKLYSLAAEGRSRLPRKRGDAGARRFQSRVPLPQARAGRRQEEAFTALYAASSSKMSKNAASDFAVS